MPVLPTREPLCAMRLNGKAEAFRRRLEDPGSAVLVAPADATLLNLRFSLAAGGAGRIRRKGPAPRSQALPRPCYNRAGRQVHEGSKSTLTLSIRGPNK